MESNPSCTEVPGEDSAENERYIRAYASIAAAVVLSRRTVETIGAER